MATSAVFLHITDPHLDGGRTKIKRDDLKTVIKGIAHKSRDALIDASLERVAAALAGRQVQLDGVIISGDAGDRSSQEGQTHLLELITKHFSEFGVSSSNIVVVPGNHDVLRGTEPSSEERYRSFNGVWRTAGCVTPWLDGIDTSTTPIDGHYHSEPARSWLVLPINSSNWSQIRTELPESISALWPKLHEIPDLKPEVSAALRNTLDDLVHVDMARISETQLEYARKLLAKATQSAKAHTLKIAVLHHHLHAPGLREELKPFADLTNLSLFRTFLREQKIDVVIHGHKHNSAIFYDYIDDGVGGDPHRTMVISGGSLIGGSDGCPVRLLTFSGLPSTPELSIEEFAIPRGGVETETHRTPPYRLWQKEEALPEGPVLLQSTDIDVLYDRAIKVVNDQGGGGTLILHLDAEDDASGDLPLPRTYEVPGISDDAGRVKWLSELVKWWQEPHSKLALRLPQAHGARMRRFGGKLDQVERIKQLLRTKTTTRAVAVLLDPFVDFESGSKKEEFASFCLVQFSRREIFHGGGASHGQDEKPRVDCIAYYRAQEFRQWWPINMAELRLVQRQISAAIGALPGRITTIAADARYNATAPMQAIVPIIDRWSDHAPETLHILANALALVQPFSDRQREVLSEWLLSLDSQIAATRAWNPDGMPVALEGFQTLRSYLLGSEPKTDRLNRLNDLLERQIELNIAWTISNREESDFRKWAKKTPAILSELRELSAGTLDPSGG